MNEFKTGNTVTTDELGTIKKVVYGQKEMRRTYYENPKNQSNYKTIIKEIKGKEGYVMYSRLEIGQKYVTYYRYDNAGKIEYERRYNRRSGSLNTREVISQTEEGSVILNTYNKEKTITFNVKNNKLKNGKQ